MRSPANKRDCSDNQSESAGGPLPPPLDDAWCRLQMRCYFTSQHPRYEASSLLRRHRRTRQKKRRFFVALLPDYPVWKRGVCAESTLNTQLLFIRLLLLPWGHQASVYWASLRLLGAPSVE
ncbi:hypothetical protein MTO96_021010 [Rhipicephalus appendiculatus]